MGSRNNKPGRIVKGTALQPSLKSASGVWSLDEAMQAHRANAWPQPDLFQPVSNSLRLKNSSASALVRQPSRPGNQRTWTWSAWLKMGIVSGTREFFNGSPSGSAFSGIRMIDGQIYIQDYSSGSYNIWWVSTALYRDTSAWYHIVVKYDTTQTQGNAAILYVNGVQQVLTFNAAVGAYAQNRASWINAANTQRFGQNIGGDYYDGQIGEVNFIDGYALQPTLFGKLDTNNTWVPVPYTGTYGTNGFYLPFTNATSSQTLGYDASLTGTTTYDVDQDPYRGSVALHLTGNGPAGGNNNTFADSSSNNLAITRGETATQGSFSPFPLNTNAPYNPVTHGASAYFNGSSDYLTVASVPAIGTQDFTVESWVYANSTAVTNGGNPRVFDIGGAQLVIEDTGKICRLDLNDANSLYVSSSNVFKLNEWTHIAVVRISNVVSFYLNGVAQLGGTRSDNLTGGTGYVGVYRTPTSGFWNGYISGLRLTIGKGIYTAAFTPTMRPFGTLTNNLITFSEDFSGYGTSQASALAGATIAPDRTPSAFKIVEDTSNSQHGINAAPTVSSGVTYTGSYYIKAAERTQAEIIFFGASATGGNVIGSSFNLISGTVTDSTASATGTIVNVGNGWWRCAVTYTTAGAGVMNVNVFSSTSTTVGGRTYQGNGTSGIFAWGSQLEVASSAGDYTPTPANYSTAPSLLLNFANSAVVDTTGANSALTGGNASISSASKYGSGALTFDGTNSYIDYPASAVYNIGTKDFTVEAWIRTSETTGDTNFRRFWMLDGPTGNAVGNIQLMTVPSTGVLELYDTSAGTGDILGTTNICNGQWHHCAISRSNATIRMFVNGKLENQISYAIALSPNSGAPRPRIGSYSAGTAGRWNGQIDDLRMTMGVARYQSDFTPPARALPETGGKSFVTTNVNAGVVQRFTTTGTTSWTAPTDVTSVEVLVIAGGGGGGASCGGGGGAGGLIYNNSYPVTPGQTYTVTVGAGGIGTGSSASRGTNGSNSVFGNLTAIGGGGGASLTAQGGLAGGSGGGDSHTGQTPGAGTAGQGFAGGRATPSAYDEAGGGGGGAGAVGFTAVGSGTTSATVAGIGGPGLAFGISGSSTFYAGGGAGGVMRGSARQLGGAGGGGNGAGNGTNATSATVNTGGGGGGGGRADLSPSASYTGGDGGSGIVIVRYTTTAVGNTSDATTDNLTDSPTLYGHDTGAGGEVVGNYCTLNPIDTETDHSFSNGNLTLFKAASNWSSVRSTMAFSSGKWYFETTYNASWDYAHVGVLDVTVDTYAGQVANTGYVGNYAKGWAYQQDARIWNNGQLSGVTSIRSVAGDICMCAVDMDNGKIWWGRNGTWFNSGNPAAGTNAVYSNLSGTVSPAFSVYGDSSGITVNFGQRAWAYAPPAGFNAITTKNLPRLAIGSAAATPNQFFDAALYTGTGAAQTITLPGAFQPDLVWMKARSAADNHVLMDSVRGTSAALFSDLTNAEVTNATRITSFNSNGFTLGSSASVNTSSATYVAWGWKAGGTAVSNTSGTIASQVSANTTSGFSIVTYTGTGVNATVGHGLGVAPSMYICKRRDSTSPWRVYHTSLSYTTYINLSDAGASASDSSVWNSAPTTSVFGIGTNDMNTNTGTYVAYCWAEIPGFSKFGSYTGNSATDGPFVYLGFRPRWLMIRKTTDTGGHWDIFDSSRNTFNLTQAALLASSNVTEYTSGQAGAVDLLSNGFKLKNADGFVNLSGSTYIYMAFADKPFGNVNGTAR